MQANKIIHVHFKDETREQVDYYFGSIIAVYSTLTPEELCIRYDSLCIALQRCEGHYENRAVIVNVGELIRNPRKKSADVEQPIN